MPDFVYPAGDGIDAGARGALEATVRAALESYRSAYAALGASAARDIWPDMDERTLSQAFGGLRSQHLAFERCEIDVQGPTATASCLGRSVEAAEAGSSTARAEARRWIFTLRGGASGWQVEQTEVRD